MAHSRQPIIILRIIFYGIDDGKDNAFFLKCPRKSKYSLNYIHTSQAYIFFIDTIEDIIIAAIRAISLKYNFFIISLIYFNSIFYRFDAAKVGFITVFAKYLG